MTFKQSVPLRVGVKLEEFDEDVRVENWPFRESVGSLMWLSKSTRPNISNAVRVVAGYCTAPRAIYWKVALGILEYINGTSEYGIAFQRGTLSSISLEVFAVADYASKAADRRSVSGGAIMCEGASVCEFCQDSELSYPFDLRSRVRCSRGRCKGVVFLRQFFFVLCCLVRSCRVFCFFKTIRVLYNWRRTRS